MPAQEYTLESPPPIPPDATNPNTVTEEKPLNPFPKKALIALAIVGVLLVFFSGFFLRGAVDKPTTVVVPTSTPTPTSFVVTTPTPTPFSEVIGSTIQFLPRKQYFDDTYVAISKKEPHKTVILSVSRIEQERNYTQYMKVNYFNGKEWIRKTVTNSLTNSMVVSNPILREWRDATTIQQQNTSDIATVMLENQTVKITSPIMKDEISIQSLPGSTKFVYQGNGSIFVDDETESAHIFYARTYSFNASDLSFLGKPETLSSQWAVFWDAEGNFYHLDAVKTPNAQTAIQDRQIGIKQTLQKVITRTSSAAARTQNPGPQYIVTLNDPIQETIQYPLTNSVNKSDKKSYQWILGTGTGSLIRSQGRTVKGLGVYEFITQVTR